MLGNSKINPRGQAWASELQKQIRKKEGLKEKGREGRKALYSQRSQNLDSAWILVALAGRRHCMAPVEGGPGVKDCRLLTPLRPCKDDARPDCQGWQRSVPMRSTCVLVTTSEMGYRG